MPVVFQPGLELILDRAVNLVVRGDLTSIGTSSQLITIRASHPGRPFGTLAVLGRAHTPVSVRIAYTRIDGGSEGDFDAVHFLGAFSVYDGSLDMRHTQLSRSGGEDGLNVKYGHVRIRDSRFHASAGDAVDLDFCKGSVRDNVVSETGNDGFDFSGSRLKVVDNVLTNLGDKGFSIGERTRASLSGNRIRGALTGIAVKDRSVAVLVENELRDLTVGIAIYQKKPWFSSGIVDYRSGTITRAETAFLTDSGAVLRSGGLGPTTLLDRR